MIFLNNFILKVSANKIHLQTNFIELKKCLIFGNFIDILDKLTIKYER